MHERVGAAMLHVAEEVMPQLRALLGELHPTDAAAADPTQPTAVLPPLHRRVRQVRAALLHAAQLLTEEEQQEGSEVETSAPSLTLPVCGVVTWGGAERTHRRTLEATEVDATLEPMLARYSQLYAERLGAQLMEVLAPHVADTAVLRHVPSLSHPCWL